MGEGQWTLQQGIDELYHAYTGAGLNEADWTGPRYYRLPTVMGLVDAGVLDKDLRRI